ncbi:PRC-barrel domain-containing protein [Pseudochelatococcus contaminans]|uniref:Sporulation protein YlmC with PRC-barrel domain n=1 Tax=Pseudochelatococcus contaminans TaxID=1538103 RepID=A0A7W5Z158_9HYPH|nr:PRC-barrel domain-containing protein [Pseudochelatococcus contaminans]MBB3808078.1 sporulation protein YlmC with PRC-barrel domain [Pseudochelatococcus contaminans]
MRNLLIASLVASSAALAAPAFAQTAPTPVTPATPVEPATPATPATPGTPATPVPVTNATALSSNLVGLAVLNAGDETVGEIQDLVLGANNQVIGVIVSVGGFLGIGEHYAVIDPETVLVTYDEADKKWHARVNATADELKAAPGFKYEGKFSR